MQKGTNREEMDRSPEFAPAVDIYDRDDEIVVVADMPGVPADSVDIGLDRGELTIRGRVKTPPVNGQVGFQEFQVGDFVRTFTLTDDIDPNGIAAEMANGVLKLHLKKPVERKPRKIQVKVG